MYHPRFQINAQRIPILSNSDIDVDAELMIREFSPHVFKDPEPIDVDRFAEYYLGLEIVPEYLSNTGCYMGRMVFEDNDFIPIYDPFSHKAVFSSVMAGTIMIDERYAEGNNESVYRSTLAHECGHWIYHKAFFLSGPRVIFADDLKAITQCKENDICLAESRKLVSNRDWIEHHAKYFSAALLLPKSAVKMVAGDPDIIKMAKELSTGSDYSESLSSIVANVFGVSKQSTNIRLRQLNINSV